MLIGNIFYWIRLGLSFILIVLFSWLLIHLMALVGVFIAFGYPLWWLFAPGRTTCLLCRAQPNGTRCSFCRQQVDKNNGMSPKNFTSAVLNAILILLFSILSMGLVYGESQALMKLGFPPVQKTASFVIPAKEQHLIGEIFPMNIEVDNIKGSINAVQADIGFDPDKIEVVTVSTRDSFASIFIQKTIDNTGGYVRLTGGVPNPGWYGTHGLFGTVYFRAKNPGFITISYLPSSLVLSNDGKGTNILQSFPAISYLVLPDKISKSAQDSQAKLFSNNVLGATTENNQLDFTDNANVLGTSIVAYHTTPPRFDPVGYVANLLQRVDKFILDLIWTVMSHI